MCQMSFEKHKKEEMMAWDEQNHPTPRGNKPLFLRLAKFRTLLFIILYSSFCMSSIHSERALEKKP
jgi:hypothetical protein